MRDAAGAQAPRRERQQQVLLHACVASSPSPLQSVTPAGSTVRPPSIEAA